MIESPNFKAPHPEQEAGAPPAEKTDCDKAEGRCLILCDAARQIASDGFYRRKKFYLTRHKIACK